MEVFLTIVAARYPSGPCVIMILYYHTERRVAFRAWRTQEEDWGFGGSRSSPTLNSDNLPLVSRGTVKAAPA